ncbi:MAG: (2Fe-2S)-binding protein [Afipia sp.]|jgi:carbon-monoxide dehydrogenase small subunit|nr:(2Fe-2S)-binding protein [Afipia sp.]
MIQISLIINGEAVTASVDPRTTLVDFLREKLNLTGTHIGCEHGVCGACTVHLDGVSARSCITLAAACDGHDIRTIEGFDEDEKMNAIRAEFSAEHALQCGYCTPGMLMTAYDVTTRFDQLEEAAIRREMSGNLCRCTGYQGIVHAIQNVFAGKAKE